MFILSKELGLGLLRKHKLILTVRPEEPIGRKESLQVVKSISPWDLLQAVEKAIGGNGKDVEVSLDKRNKEPDCVRLFAETTNDQTVSRISDKLSGLSLKLKGTPGRLVVAVEGGTDQSTNQKRPWEAAFGSKAFASLPPGQRTDTVRIDGLPRAWFRRKRLEGEPEPSLWDVERDIDTSLLGKVFSIFGDVTFVDVFDDDQGEKAISQSEQGGGGVARGAKVGIVFSACVQYKESSGFSKAMDKLWGDIKTLLVRTGGSEEDGGRCGEAVISVDFERTGYMSNFSRRERRFAREQRRLKDIEREKKRKEEEERREREREREERERREREEEKARRERERLEAEERERQAEIEREEREKREREEREEAARRELEEFIERQKWEREEEARRERERLEKERLAREAEEARKAEAARLLRERLEEERRETERREAKIKAVREERLSSLHDTKNRMQRHVLSQLLEAAGKEVGEKVREREERLKKRQREEDERVRREGEEKEVRVLHRRVEVLARRREILLEAIENARRSTKRQRVDD